MTNERTVRDEPEPIDAEFEPKEKPRARSSQAFGAPPRLRSRSASRVELLIASIAAAAIGATMAIIVTNANSGASTGTLASELDALRSGQDEIGGRISQMSSDAVTLRSRIEAQADRLDRQDQGELALRGEISAVTAQVSALIGAGSGNAETPGAVANNSPLGKLLARITKLETALSTDASSPQTTKQMQRSVADLSEKVTALQAANANLSAALDQRQAALAALEDGMKVLSSEVGVLRGRAADSQKFGTGVGVLRKPTVDLSTPGQAGKAEAAATESRTIRAFSTLESAAQRSTPFVSQQEALAALLPLDADVAALSAPAMHGVPSIEQLRREFTGAASNAGRLTSDQADDGWNWLRATFPGFGDTRAAEADRNVGAAIVKARRSLEGGDARGALQTIATLPAPASGAFEKWREKAQRRADLDERLAALNRRLLGAAATPSGGG